MAPFHDLTEELEHMKATGEVGPIILGFNDGIVSILALVAGITGAIANNAIVLLAGVVGMVGGAISMALGGYISSKSELDLYRGETERESQEIERKPEAEERVVKRIFHQKGFEGDLLDRIVGHVTANKKLWLETVLKEELGMAERKESPVATALHQGVSFVMGSLVAVVPYLFFTPSQALMTAVIWSAGALFLVGALKTGLTGLWIKSGVEQLLVGMVAAGAAYFVGSLVPIPVELF